MQVSLLYLVAFCSLLSNAADWAYSGHHGPSDWKETYKQCGGSKQSPINISPSSTEFVDFRPLKFTGYDTVGSYNISLMNNGHTVQVNIDSGSLTVEGAALPGSYRLAQFHVHWGATNDAGSEHTVSNKKYPLEIHFVHYNSDVYPNISEAADKPGGLAVIGVFGQVDRIAFPNEALQQIIDNFASVRYRDNKTAIERPFQLSGLLPENTRDFYRYSGSLTTPPCYESVIWTVLKEPIKISQIQLNSFRTLSHKTRQERDEPLADNYRPVQPIGSRTVLRSFQLPTATPKPSVRAGGKGLVGQSMTSTLLVVALATVLQSVIG